MSQSDKYAVVGAMFGCALGVWIGTQNFWLGLAAFNFCGMLVFLSGK